VCGVDQHPWVVRRQLDEEDKAEVRPSPEIVMCCRVDLIEWVVLEALSKALLNSRNILVSLTNSDHNLPGYR
jgi:hypothetical protein